ncbi:hypothetical protein K443DRAFT_339953 [Laccaria amethystina LaAM-08-1]|uniref:Uncharacterized protein n=1 Tax=Laccaria amethystina LaAM-08-1 TaxID=1095629 RepID=A0A0C9X182_9AGAR|nr:hypothetical protein K443DRAFT_339953 [Laccaria amethystina LaAM-08-1]
MTVLHIDAFALQRLYQRDSTRMPTRMAKYDSSMPRASRPSIQPLLPGTSTYLLSLTLLNSQNSTEQLYLETWTKSF